MKKNREKNHHLQKKENEGTNPDTSFPQQQLGLNNDEEEEEAVTNENKKEYVDLVIQYYLKSTSLQMEAIRQGFLEVVPQNFLDELEPDELEMVLFGKDEVDVKDLQENTEYGQGFSISSPVVLLFWEVIEKFDQENLHKLLSFCTGSSKVPLGGFAHLIGSNGPQKFTITPKSSPGLPVAHACFNRLELYQHYSDTEALKKDLLYSLNETQGFRME